MLRKVYWSCSPWPGGVHWYTHILVDAEKADDRIAIEHPKFETAERALMWIEHEFEKLGAGYELWDSDELVGGVEAMRAEIRRRNERCKQGQTWYN